MTIKEKLEELYTKATKDNQLGIALDTVNLLMRHDLTDSCPNCGGSVNMPGKPETEND